MVFGWGKKKHSDTSVKKSFTDDDDAVAASTTRNIEITMTEIPAILAEQSQTKAAHTVHDVIYLRDALVPLVDNLMEIGVMLEKDDLKVDDIDKHLALLVIRGKKQVIEIIKKEVKPLPPVSDIDDVPVFETTLRQILKKMGLVLGRQSRVIHIFAKKYAGHLKSDLETMNDHMTQLQKLMTVYNSTVLDGREIIDTIKHIDNLKSHKKEQSQKISKLRNDIKIQGDAIESTKISITQIKSSKHYAQFLNIKDSLDLLKTQRGVIRNTINSRFAKISRPLGRYQYGSSLDKEQKKILSELINDPFNVLVESNADSIMEILANVRRGITSGSITVKDVRKMLLHMDDLEGAVGIFIQQISENSAESQKLKSDMDAARPDELDKLEIALSEHIKSKNSNTERVDTILDNIDDSSSQIILLGNKIKVMLEKFTKSQYTLKQ